jgi:non-ribosomal peptide synthetase component F
MAVAMWSCHLAGCIYTPINATLPLLSKRYILENTNASFYICSPSTLPEPAAVPPGTHIIVIDPKTLRVELHPLSPHAAAGDFMEDKPLLELQSILDAALNHRPTQPDDTAYYIHTSGSTGKPKCVVHVHSSLDWHSHVTLLGSGLTRADDTCLQVADCSFDLHIRDIFCFISTGGHVVTIPPAALNDMSLLCDLFFRHRLRHPTQNSRCRASELVSPPLC